MIDLLPPKMDIKINIKIRLNVLAGVLEELTALCGLSLEEDLKKGVLDRDVIQRITVNFYDCPHSIRGRIFFDIDWERFEFLAKTDEGDVLYSSLDYSKTLSSQLDKRLYDAVKVYVNRVKSKYNIIKVSCNYRYREKYKTTPEVYEASLIYMGHVCGSGDDTVKDDVAFANEITAAFQGLDGLLKVTFKT